MKRILVLSLSVLVLLAGCGPAVTATPTADANATLQSMNATMVADILTSQPTKTPVPTDTPTPIPPTETPVPSDTPTLTPTITPTSVAVYGCIAPGGVTPKTAPFKIENHTKSNVDTFFNGVSFDGDHPINCSFSLSKSQVTFFTIMWGNYTWMVQVGNKKTFQGHFYVNDWDKIVMQISDSKVSIGTGP